MSVILQVRVNGGAPQTGGVSAVETDTIQLTAASMATWSTPVARWEIYDYPAGFAAPAGWSTDPDGVYYYEGNSDPPSFAITSGDWGRYITKLYATDGGVQTSDLTTSIDVPDPVSGVSNIGRGEGAIFGGPRVRWVAPMKAAIKYVVETSAAFGTATYDADPDTIPLRDGDGDIEFRNVYCDEVVAKTTNLIARSAAGGYFGIAENATEIARLSDDAAVSAFDFQGANARISVSGGLRLWSVAGEWKFQSGTPATTDRIRVAYENPDLVFEAAPDVGGVFAMSSSTGMSLSATTGQVGVFGNNISLQSNTTVDVVANSGALTLTAAGATGSASLNASTSVTLTAGASNVVDLKCGAGSQVRLFENATAIANFSDEAGVSTMALQGATTSNVSVASGILALSSASGSHVVLREGATETFRASDETNVSTLSGRGSSGTELVANTSNLTLKSANAGYVAVFEGTAEVCRIDDSSTRGQIDFKGALGGRVLSTTNDLQLRGASGLTLQHGATDTFNIDLNSSISRILGQGTAGTQMGTVVASQFCQLRCGSGSQVRIQESSTDVCYFSDESNVSTISGRGSGGTELNATTGNLNLKCASGNKVNIAESGASTSVDVYDSAGVCVMDLNSGTASLISATNLLIRGAGYVQVEMPSGAVRCTFGGAAFSQRNEYWAGSTADGDAPAAAHRIGFLGTGGIRYFDHRFARKQTAASGATVIWTSPDLPAGCHTIYVTVNASTTSGATGGSYELKLSVRSNGTTPVILGSLSTAPVGTPDIVATPTFSAALSGAGVTISGNPNAATTTHFQMGKIEIVYGAAAA